MGYKVKLPVFEGPFDLLVYLIESARMNIYDIQIAQITTQYLSYLEEMNRMDVAVASEFMVLAAALIEIKSKMLLPRLKNSGEETADFEDPREELVARLLEYKRFKNAAEMLENREGEMQNIFEKPQEDLSPYTNEPDIDLILDLQKFTAAFNAFLLKKKKLEDIHKTVSRIEAERQTTEVKMAFIQSVLKDSTKKAIRFGELLQSQEDRYEIVLTFSTLLEMAKQKAVRLKQKHPFGEITILEGRTENDQQKNNPISV